MSFKDYARRTIPLPNTTFRAGFKKGDLIQCTRSDGRTIKGVFSHYGDNDRSGGRKIWAYWSGYDTVTWVDESKAKRAV